MLRRINIPLVGGRGQFMVGSLWPIQDAGYPVADQYLTGGNSNTSSCSMLQNIGETVQLS